MLSLPRLQILIHSSLYFTLGLTKAPDGNEATVLLATVPQAAARDTIASPVLVLMGLWTR